MRRAMMLALMLGACDKPPVDFRELQLAPGCEYKVHYTGPTGCVQDAALCYADLAEFCEYDAWACWEWSQWCADEAQACLKEAGGEG